MSKSNAATIWIIDDNKHFCILLKESLRVRSFRKVSYFFGIPEALSGSGKKKQGPDVILLDIGMPEINGIDGMELLLSRWPECKIVMLTSHENEQEITRSLRMGAAGYLLKTSSAEDIERSIGNVLSGGLPLDPQITSKIIDILLSQKERDPGMFGLTTREVQIVNLISRGLSAVKIAQQLNVSYNTVVSHQKNIYRKLQVHSKSGLVAKAYKEGIVGD